MFGTEGAVAVGVYTYEKWFSIGGPILNHTVEYFETSCQVAVTRSLPLDAHTKSHRCYRRAR